MFARLTALVGSGTGLPFDVTEESSLAWGSWTHARGIWKADGSAVSVFRVSSGNPADPKLTAARNGTKRLRTMRHPNVVVFKESLEIEEKGEHVIYLVTEPVTPLASFLETTELTGQDRQEYMNMGFHALVAAVAFLNIDCGLVHGGICAGSVAVTERLDWKLWGLDMLTEHAAVGPGSPLAASAWLVAAQYKPGELGRGDWDGLRAAPAWAVDAWGLGCLMQELYSGHALERLEDLRRTEVVPKPLVPWYQRLLASNPARRASPAALRDAGVLRTALVQTVAFLENLALKEGQEKDAFFKRLPGVLPDVPLPVRQRKVLPLLAGALEYGGAPPSALAILLSIGQTMDDTERAAAVVPVIVKLFASTDRAIRRGLLENVTSYGPALPDALVDERIFGHLAAGFTDANPYLRELTLKSMAVLGPKLSQKTLNQSLLKHLAKLQVDEEPSIRANTTVLLGALAPSLSEATCKKVLLNAFTRALRDGFPPARAAGLRALVATAKFHSPEEAAGRILPAVAPLCLDPVADVRVSAMECVDTFTAVIREHQEVLRVREAEKAAAAGGAAAAGNATSGAAAGGSLLTGLGWAASSLGLSRSGAAPSVPGSAAASPAKPAAPAATQPPAAPTAEQPAAVTQPLTRQAPPVTTTDEGWDEEDDDDDEGLQEELRARQRLSGVNLGGAPRRPSTSRPPSGLTSSGLTSSGLTSSGRASPAAPAPATTVSSAAGPTAGGHVSVSADAGWFDEEASAAPARPAPRPRPAVARRPGGGGMKLGVTKLAPSAKTEDFDSW